MRGSGGGGKRGNSSNCSAPFFGWLSEEEKNSLEVTFPRQGGGDCELFPVFSPLFSSPHRHTRTQKIERERRGEIHNDIESKSKSASPPREIVIQSNFPMSFFIRDLHVGQKIRLKLFKRPKNTLKTFGSTTAAQFAQSVRSTRSEWGHIYSD